MTPRSVPHTQVQAGERLSDSESPRPTTVRQRRPLSPRAESSKSEDFFTMSSDAMQGKTRLFLSNPNDTGEWPLVALVGQEEPSTDCHVDRTVDTRQSPIWHSSEVTICRKSRAEERDSPHSVTTAATAKRINGSSDFSLRKAFRRNGTKAGSPKSSSKAGTTRNSLDFYKPSSIAGTGSWIAREAELAQAEAYSKMATGVIPAPLRGRRSTALRTSQPIGQQTPRPKRVETETPGASHDNLVPLTLTHGGLAYGLQSTSMVEEDTVHCLHTMQSEAQAQLMASQESEFFRNYSSTSEDRHTVRPESDSNASQMDSSFTQSSFVLQTAARQAMEATSILAQVARLEARMISVESYMAKLKRVAKQQQRLERHLPCASTKLAKEEQANHGRKPHHTPSSSMPPDIPHTTLIPYTSQRSSRGIVRISGGHNDAAETWLASASSTSSLADSLHSPVYTTSRRPLASHTSTGPRERLPVLAPDAKINTKLGFDQDVDGDDNYHAADGEYCNDIKARSWLLARIRSERLLRATYALEPEVDDLRLALSKLQVEVTVSKTALRVRIPDVASLEEEEEGCGEHEDGVRDDFWSEVEDDSAEVEEEEI